MNIAFGARAIHFAHTKAGAETILAGLRAKYPGNQFFIASKKAIHINGNFSEAEVKGFRKECRDLEPKQVLMSPVGAI